MKVFAYATIVFLVFGAPLISRVSAYSYSCAGAGCSIDANGCSANPYTGTSGCACSYLGNEVVCTQPTTNQSAGGAANNGQAGNHSSSNNPSQIQNPLGVNSLCGLIQVLLRAAIAIGIPVAVLFIVFAGFKFILAQGNPTELAKARSNMMYTFVGIGIFLGAWLLANVVANTVNHLQSNVQGPASASCS